MLQTWCRSSPAWWCCFCMSPLPPGRAEVRRGGQTCTNAFLIRPSPCPPWEIRQVAMKKEGEGRRGKEDLLMAPLSSSSIHSSPHTCLCECGLLFVSFRTAPPTHSNFSKLVSKFCFPANISSRTRSVDAWEGIWRRYICMGKAGR